MKRKNLICIPLILISLFGCRLYNENYIHNSSNTIMDDRIIGAWVVGRDDPFPQKSFVINKINKQYFLTESIEVNKSGPVNKMLVARCYEDENLSTTMKLWLIKIGEDIYAEVEDKTCNDSSMHAYSILKVDIKNEQLTITPPHQSWVKNLSRDSQYKKYLEGKDFKDIFNIPKDKILDMILNERVGFNLPKYEAERVPNNITILKEAADEALRNTPLLKKHFYKYRDEYKKVNNGTYPKVVTTCYGEAALLYKVSFMLGDKESEKLWIEALRKYVKDIKPYLKEDNNDTLFSCKAMLSTYNNFVEKEKLRNVVVGIGLGVSALKKVFDWTFSSSSSSNYSSSGSSSSSIDYVMVNFESVCGAMLCSDKNLNISGGPGNFEPGFKGSSTGAIHKGYNGAVAGIYQWSAQLDNTVCSGQFRLSGVRKNLSIRVYNNCSDAGTNEY